MRISSQNKTDRIGGDSIFFCKDGSGLRGREAKGLELRPSERGFLPRLERVSAVATNAPTNFSSNNGEREKMFGIAVFFSRKGLIVC